MVAESIVASQRPTNPKYTLADGVSFLIGPLLPGKEYKWCKWIVTCWSIYQASAM